MQINLPHNFRKPSRKMPAVAGPSHSWAQLIIPLSSCSKWPVKSQLMTKMIVPCELIFTSVVLFVLTARRGLFFGGTVLSLASSVALSFLGAVCCMVLGASTVEIFLPCFFATKQRNSN